VDRRANNEHHAVRVLVVDDDSDLVEAYRTVLELAGYDVATALSGEAALGEARSHRPDVVLTDVSMPRMDGFELIHHLQDELGGETPPVVVCSAFDVTEQEAMARGAGLFLRKPASAETLVHSIEAIRRGAPVDDEAMDLERAHVAHERLASQRGSAERLREVDRRGVARAAKPWLEWLRGYFDASSAGLFLLEDGAVIPAVVVGPHMPKGPEHRLLHVTLAAGVETGTSLVVADMATHPTFRHAGGPRSHIASFAGVPLATADGVRVGALCIADARAGRFDAESLVVLEHLGRRGVMGLIESDVKPASNGTALAPLLPRRTFEFLLTTELRIARRHAEAIEVAIGDLGPGVSSGTLAARVWRVGAHPRLAIGAMGLGRVGLFARGTARDAREHIAGCLKDARAQSLVEAAGVAAIGASAPLSSAALVELAESALSMAEQGGAESHVERFVVKTEHGKYLA
jgi:CheY-like chemotaxis protein